MNKSIVYNLSLHPSQYCRYLSVPLLDAAEVTWGHKQLMNYPKQFISTFFSFCWCSRRPGWLGRLFSCPLKSISRVQFSPSTHIRRDLFLHKKWLAESARAWIRDIWRKSTSSGNAESYARWKLKARTGGEKGRHLWPRLVQKIAEGKTSYELSWKVEVMGQKKKKKVQAMSRTYLQQCYTAVICRCKHR